MTLKYKVTAFVFKKTDVNEADRNFSVFTDNFGRLDIFAKAIRKNASKLKSGMDVFFTSEIEFIQGKNRKTLTDAVLVERFNNIEKDLAKFNIANKIGNVLDGFIKGEEKDKEIYNLVGEVMKKLDGQDNNNFKIQPLIFHYFLWNFFSMQGYKSEVKLCAGCSEALNQSKVYFSGRVGGIICEKCLAKDGLAQKVNSDIVKILRIILLKDWQTLSKLKVEPASQKLLEEISETAIRTFCPTYC